MNRGNMPGFTMRLGQSNTGSKNSTGGFYENNGGGNAFCAAFGRQRTRLAFHAVAGQDVPRYDFECVFFNNSLQLRSSVHLFMIGCHSVFLGL